MSSEAEEAGSTAQKSWPLWGGDKFTWGVVHGRRNPVFKPDDASWLVKNTVFGGQEIKARQCDSCRNIQLFAAE